MSVPTEASYDPTPFVANLSNLFNSVLLLRDQTAREESLHIPDTYLELPLNALLTECSWLQQAAVDGFWRPFSWSTYLLLDMVDFVALEQCGSIFTDLSRNPAFLRYELLLIIGTDPVHGDTAFVANALFRQDPNFNGLGAALERLEANLKTLLRPLSSISIIGRLGSCDNVQASSLQRRTMGKASEGIGKVAEDTSSLGNLLKSLMLPVVDEIHQGASVHRVVINDSLNSGISSSILKMLSLEAKAERLRRDLARVATETQMLRDSFPNQQFDESTTTGFSEARSEALISLHGTYNIITQHESYRRGLFHISDVFEKLKSCRRGEIHQTAFPEADVRRAIAECTINVGADTHNTTLRRTSRLHDTNVLEAVSNMTATSNAGNGTTLQSTTSPEADSPWSVTDGPAPPYALSPSGFYHTSIEARISALENLG